MQGRTLVAAGCKHQRSPALRGDIIGGSRVGTEQQLQALGVAKGGGGMGRQGRCTQGQWPSSLDVSTKFTTRLQQRFMIWGGSMSD